MYKYVCFFDLVKFQLFIQLIGKIILKRIILDGAEETQTKI
jgi:hypothetical protein